VRRRRWSAGAQLALIVIALAIAGSAQADTYWNVWQGNLPDSSGIRHKTSLYGGPAGYAWNIRMSWTVGSHGMWFLVITNDGGWHQYTTASYGDPVTSNWDLVFAYWYNAARAGCQNPGTLATVWVNCRNAMTY
jgi:hypothetical protein